ncbi:MAG: tRNA dihydrouridine synthase [Syntrophobacteraceae bacterium]
MSSFWDLLPKPVFTMAPLSGVTDSAFRRVCKRYGADVVYSELASATAFLYQPEPSLRILSFHESERPYVVQLFGNNPEHFAFASRFVTREIKPDGIDINFGCPIPKVFNRGAGAALMTNLSLAKEVIQSVIENTHLPVSIKTRTKVKEVDLFSFLDYISDLDVKTLMIHGRTYAQRFSGPNDIETTRNARKHFKGILLANGGVGNAAQGFELLEKTSADGLGIARGALGNPWIFRSLKDRLNGNGDNKPSGEEVSRIATEHAELLIGKKGYRGIIEMRKHLCWYLQQVPGTKKLRQKAVTIAELQDIVDLFKQPPFEALQT